MQRVAKLLHPAQYAMLIDTMGSILYLYYFKFYAGLLIWFLTQWTWGRWGRDRLEAHLAPNCPFPTYRVSLWVPEVIWIRLMDRLLIMF